MVWLDKTKESRRRWKVKEWRSLEDTYTSGGENWKKKEKKIYFIV